MVDRLECVSGLPTADESVAKPGAYVSLRVEKGTHLVCACSDQPVLYVVPLLAGLCIGGDVRLVPVLQVRPTNRHNSADRCHVPQRRHRPDSYCINRGEGVPPPLSVYNGERPKMCW